MSQSELTQVSRRNQLFGKSRREALMQIESAFDRCVQGSEPSVVVISGITGSGKSRLVQEFFNQISGRQPEPKYWSEKMFDSSNGVSLLKSRNVIHPQRVVGNKSERSFSWYAQVCRRSADDPELQFQSAFDSNRKLIESHLKRKSQRISAYVSAAFVLGALTLEFVDNFFPLPALLQWGARVTGVISFGWSLRALWENVYEPWASSQTEVGAESKNYESVFENSFEFIRIEVERFRTPIVVIIDDWHAADHQTQKFVDDLSRLRGPCFIILTRWLTGGVLSDQSRLADEIEADVTVSIELRGLETEELVEILRIEKPEYPLNLLRTIAEHSVGNPLIALKLCEFPQVIALSSQDNIEETEMVEVINQLPFDHDGVLKEQWRAVPTEVQQFLSIASIYGEIIPTELVKKAFSAYFKADPSRTLDLAREPYWWLQILQADIDAFPDASLYRIAKDEASFTLGKGKLALLQTDVAMTNESDLPDGLRRFGVYGDLMAERKLAQRIAHGIKTKSLSDAELVYRSVYTLGGSRFVNLRLQICREQIEWLTQHTPQSSDVSLHSDLLTRFRYYEFKSVAANDPDAGIEIGTLLLGEMLDHPLRADLMLRLGNLSIDLKDYSTADTYYKQVLAEKPPNHIAAAATENLLLVMSLTNRTEEAISRLRKIQWRQKSRVRMLRFVRPLSRQISQKIDAEEVQILVRGNNIGSWLGRSGNTDKAVRVLRKSIKRASKLQISAENREKVWRCKSSLGYWSFKSGDALASRDLLTEITSELHLIDSISWEHHEAISAIQTLAAVEAYLGNVERSGQILSGLVQPETMTQIRIAEDQKLKERHEFIEFNLKNPEVLMRDF